jgi:hypothetical protein
MDNCRSLANSNLVSYQCSEVPVKPVTTKKNAKNLIFINIFFVDEKNNSIFAVPKKRGKLNLVVKSSNTEDIKCLQYHN